MGRKIERIMELGRREKGYGRLPKLIHKSYLYNVSPYLNPGGRALKQKLLSYPLGAADKDLKLGLPSPIKANRVVPTSDLLVMKRLPTKLSHQPKEAKIPNSNSNPSPSSKPNQSISKGPKPTDNEVDNSY